MSNNKIQDTFATAYLAGAKAEFYILILKVEQLEKEKGKVVDNAFEKERYAIKVLLDFAANALDDQKKKDYIQAVANHVLLDTLSNELKEVYQEFTKFTV